MNVAEKWVKERLEATSPGRKLINTRLSNMTEDKEDQGRSKCQFRNQCGRGCSFGAYDRKSVVEGKSVSVRVDLGGRRIITRKTRTPTQNKQQRHDIHH